MRWVLKTLFETLLCGSYDIESAPARNFIGGLRLAIWPSFGFGLAGTCHETRDTARIA